VTTLGCQRNQHRGGPTRCCTPDWTCRERGSTWAGGDPGAEASAGPAGVPAPRGGLGDPTGGGLIARSASIGLAPATGGSSSALSDSQRPRRRCMPLRGLILFVRRASRSAATARPIDGSASLASTPLRWSPTIPSGRSAASGAERYGKPSS
jgi:hypothetical protein